MNNIRNFFTMNNPHEQITITNRQYDLFVTWGIIISTTLLCLFLLVYNLYRIGGLL
jgi:hypothetical protein